MKSLLWITLAFLPTGIFSQESFPVSWKKEAFIWTGIGIGHWYVQTEFKSMEAPAGLLDPPINSNPLSRWSRRQYSSRMDSGSDIILNSLMFSGIIWRSPVFSKMSSSRQWASEVLTYTEALAFSSLLNLWVRSASYSPRPLAYNPDTPDSRLSKGEVMGSFYSGHSSAAFLTAVYFGNIFKKEKPGSKWTPFLYVCGISAASLVAYMRMEAGTHYFTDVTAGAVIGSLFAWGYPLIKKGGLTPKVNLENKSLGMNWNQYF